MLHSGHGRTVEVLGLADEETLTVVVTVTEIGAREEDDEGLAEDVLLGPTVEADVFVSGHSVVEYVSVIVTVGAGVGHDAGGVKVDVDGVGQGLSVPVGVGVGHDEEDEVLGEELLVMVAGQTVV
jgi:hypothetical protein